MKRNITLFLTIMFLFAGLTGCGGTDVASNELTEDDITEEHYKIIRETALDVDAVYAEYKALLESNTPAAAKAALLISLGSRAGVESAFLSSDGSNITINYANGIGAVLETEFLELPGIEAGASTMTISNIGSDNLAPTIKRESVNKATPGGASFGGMNYGLFFFPFHYEQTMACQNALGTSDPNYSNCTSLDSYPFPAFDFEQIKTLESYYYDPQLPGVSYGQKFLDAEASVEAFRGVIGAAWSGPAHVMISAHGGVRNIGDNDQYAVICLHDSADEVSTPATAADLLSGRLVMLKIEGSPANGIPASKRLAVTPKFIQYYGEKRAEFFPSDGLFLHYYFWSCYGFDSEMESAIMGAGGAASFAAFTGRVTRAFSKEVGMKFFKDQLTSNSVKETFNNTIVPNQCDPDNPTTCFSVAVKEGSSSIFDPVTYFYKAFLEITDGPSLDNPPNPPDPQKLETGSAGSLMVSGDADSGFFLGGAIVEPNIYPPVGIAGTWSITFDNTAEGEYSMASSDLVRIELGTMSESWEASLSIQQDARDHGAGILADECYADITIEYSDDKYIIGSIDAVMLNSDYSDKLGIKGMFYALKTSMDIFGL